MGELEPAERDSLWRYPGDKFKRGVLLSYPMKPPDAGVFVSAQWALPPEAQGDFMFAVPGYVVDSFHGNAKRAVKAAGKEVARAHRGFVARLLAHRQDLNARAQKLARDWRLPWAWAPCDIRDGFVVDLYRRAFSARVERTLHIRIPYLPPFSFELFRGADGPCIRLRTTRSHEAAAS